MRETGKILISVLILLIFLALPFISADVISLNSGGSGNIIVNPGAWIEDFFFGDHDACVPTTCVALGYECDTWNDTCGGTLNCGSCPTGSSCSSGTCVAGDTGGDDGGGTGGTTIPALNIEVEPTEINLNLAVNTNSEGTIIVTNLGTTTVNFSISESGLGNMVILSADSMGLLGGEQKTFNAIFVAPGVPGTYTGSLFVDGVTIPVALNVKTKLLLFDSNIVVLNEDYQVHQGSDLQTQVTLIPMGDPERLDVTLRYSIKDYKGKIYLTKSETLLVERLTQFKRSFDTGALPLGDYIVNLELVYSNGVAPSSAHFEVIEPLPTNIFAIIVLILIALIILILLIIIIIILYRRLKEEDEEGTKTVVTPSRPTSTFVK